MAPAAAKSASPAANRPVRRAATIKLRIGSTDHKADTAPQRIRHPSNTPATPRVGLSLFPLVDSTIPAAHSPAVETSAATPRGTNTRSGKNSNTAMSRLASKHAAIGWRVSREGGWISKSRRVSLCSLFAAVAESAPTCSASLAKGRFLSLRRKKPSHARHFRANPIRAPNSPRWIRRNPCGSFPEPRLPGSSLP